MKYLFLLAILISAGAPAAQGQAPTTVEHFRRPGSTAPFSPAVRVGNMLYLSGAIGARPDGTMPDGIEAQARQVMENIRTTLSLAGRSLDDVVKCTVMLEAMSDWPAFNKVYVTYFTPERLPARSAFGVDGLALGSLVEVECMAHVPTVGGAR